MLKEFMDLILAKTARPKVETVYDIPYLIKPDGEHVTLYHPDEMADTIDLTSLTSLVDFTKGIADADRAGLTAHVVSPDTVKLFGPVFGVFKQRPYVASAHPMMLNHHFGDRLSQESMIVWLNTAFMPTDNAKLLLQVISSLRDESVAELVDDGFSQSVMAKTGTAKFSNVTIPNPVKLVPIRTFHEVEQVETDFLLRIKGRNELVLREADGGAWKLTAVNRVKSYLKTHMPSDVLVI